MLDIELETGVRPRIVPDALLRIRRFLDDLRYDELQRALRRDYGMTPFPQYREWKATINNLNPSIKLAYELLLLGDAIDRAAAERAWGKTIVRDFLVTQMIGATDEQLCSHGYSLISYERRYALASLHTAYPAAERFDSPIYVGPDSYGLVRALPRRAQFGRVLELCAGSGLCSMVLADRAQQVIGVELNADAVAVARFNAAFNGVQERVDLREGSLYRPIGAQQFDLIVANPPFLPVPSEIEHPLAMCGNGGSDGFSVLGELLDGVGAHLAADGLGVVYAEGLGTLDGTADRAFITDRLAQLAATTQLDITLRLIGRMPIKQMLRLKGIALAHQGAGPLAELPRWRAMYERSGATHSYNFLIELRHGSGHLLRGTERRRSGPEPHFAAGKGAYVDQIS